MSPETLRDAALFFNRELSWLAFNERVLEEAADDGTPLLERLKFVAIAGGNLDEFFMVRVAALHQAVTSGHASADPAGVTAAEQLAGAGRPRHSNRAVRRAP
jgi:polyphosphate kinase